MQPPAAAAGFPTRFEPALDDDLGQGQHDLSSAVAKVVVEQLIGMGDVRKVEMPSFSDATAPTWQSIAPSASCNTASKGSAPRDRRVGIATRQTGVKVAIAVVHFERPDPDLRHHSPGHCTEEVARPSSAVLTSHSMMVPSLPSGQSREHSEPRFEIRPRRSPSTSCTERGPPTAAHLL